MILRWRECICAPLICMLWVSAGGNLRAQGPVDGDAALLRVLQDRQETNRTLFREGECDFAVEERVQGIRARGHLVWRGDETFWDYVYEQKLSVPRPQGPQQQLSTTRARMIEVPGRLIWYNAGASLAQTYKTERRGSGYQMILELRPDQAWFAMDGAFGARPAWNWHNLLDPSYQAEYLTKVVVRREAGERVVFERHYKSGGVLRIEASLSHGGNVIAYEREPHAKRPARPSDDAPVWNKGRYEWAQDTDGNWYPTHFEFQRSSTGGPPELDFDFSLDITAFNPHPRIARNRFQFASLEVAPGTTVEEFGSDRKTERTYRVGRDGKQESTLDQSVLEDLAERLREGFAAPKRDRK